MGKTRAITATADSAPFSQFRGRMIAPQTCAVELETSEFTIHRWVRAGKIRAVKLSSRCTRIDGDSLADFLEAAAFVPGEREPQPEQLRRGATAKALTAQRG